MSEGAKQANDESRHYAERQHREHMTQLFMRIEIVLTAIHNELVWRFRDDPPPEPPA